VCLWSHASDAVRVGVNYVLGQHCWLITLKSAPREFVSLAGNYARSSSSSTRAASEYSSRVKAQALSQVSRS